MLQIKPLLKIFGICFIFSCCAEKKELKKPNIVLFLVDDLGWQDTSVAFWHKKTTFNKTYKTPNMERLAAKGVKCTQAYATPICSPTRVSLMTGMNAARHRVTNWTLHKNAMKPMENNHKNLSFPFWNVNGIDPKGNIPHAVKATCLPQILKDAGYVTIHAGKAHFGAIGTAAENPLNIGFDVNIAGHAAGAPQSYLGVQDFGNKNPAKAVWAVPGLDKYHGENIFLTEALTLEALSVMDSVKKTNKPFFLYMAHYAVHTPIMGDNRFLKQYTDKGMPPIEAKYASMIEGVDKSLGDILNYLENNTLTENTIVIFMSDNGGLSAHARAGKPHTHNHPLNSGKGSIYEGGIREPMIVKWPGVTKANSINDNYLIIEDFFPSILEMARVKNYNLPQKIDGKSFVSYLKDPLKNPSDNRPLFWHYPNKWGGSGPGIGAFSAVRLGAWKLIYYHENERYELFNIINDISEKNNVININTEKAQQLADILGNYLKTVKAQMPTHKKNGKPVPYPKSYHIKS